MLKKILDNKKFIIFYLLIISSCSIQSLCNCGDEGSTDPNEPDPVTSSYNVFAETHDGGLNWDPLDTVKFGTKELYCGALTNFAEIFLIAGSDTSGRPTIWRSTDYGDSFEIVFQGSGFNPFIKMVNTIENGEDIVAVTLDADFYVSNDGGLNWTSAGGGNTTVNDLDFFDYGQIGIAACVNGEIYRTQNGGYSWVLVNTGAGANLNGVSCIGGGTPGDTVIAVGENSTIVRSTNAGLTWMSLPNSTQSTNYCVSFSEQQSGRYGILVSFNKSYKSTDGGDTWVMQDVIYNGTGIGDILTYSSGMCLITNAFGVSYSQNFGVTWSSVSMGAKLYSLVPRGQNYIFSVGK